MNYILILILILIFVIFYINIDSFYNVKDNINSLDEYIYYQTDDDEYIYYVNMYYNSPSVIETRPVHFNAASFYMDRNKNIIDYSRNIFMSDEFNEKPETYNILNKITDEELDNAIYIGENIIGITKWQILYGHVHDELYLLYDFYNKINKNSDIKYTVLYEFANNNDVFKYPYTNIEMLNSYLFDDINTINPYIYKYNIIKMRKVMIIRNLISDNIFHSFPYNANNKILSKINNNNINNKNVYISRGKCLHHPKRNFYNENEIKQYLLDNNYIVINPENMNINDFINNVRHADNIVITWGSALTNMVYLKKNTNVYILKAEGYNHEPFSFFEKIAKNYSLNINIIYNVNNKIEIPFL